MAYLHGVNERECNEEMVWVWMGMREFSTG